MEKDSFGGAADLPDFETLRKYLAVKETEEKEWKEYIMNIFLVINGCTVLFMQCGFALLEAGAVRSKNVTNILLKNFLDLLIGIVVYWACGFAFAYGKVKLKDDHGNYTGYSNANTFMGHKHFFLMDDFYGEFFYNFVFAATATTITSGALAERCKMSAYFIYGIILTGFLQPVTVHWTWSNGFLLYPQQFLNFPPEVYFRDYAGGVNVHAVGGLAGLVGCIFMGPRLGRFDTTRKYHIPGHSTPLTGLGAFILMTGFLGMVLGHGQNIELSATNIVLGGATSAMMIKRIKPLLAGHGRHKQHWSFLILVDSTLCGMVALCGPCNIIPTYGAAVIGVLASLSFLGIEHLMVKFRIDDPLGSFATHFGGGVVGCIMTPFFMVKEHAGLNDGACLYSPFYQLAWHIVGLLCIFVWTIVLSVLVFGLLWYFDELRVKSDSEIRGIDIKLHGEPAYPNAAYGHGWDNEGDFALEVLEVRNSLSDQEAQARAHTGIHSRRTVKALINPNLRENWKNEVRPGGLIEMTIAEQQKTMKMLKNLLEEESDSDMNLGIPMDTFTPLSVIGTGQLQERLKQREMVASTFSKDGISNPACEMRDD
ncbi:unnamed protein product [Oikopleura dioica]|uniref:Ammonium transporter AmtB-like domain-containing protein n=1 Tax=Oikopleura dioica TaxID=34765 RepID=E4YHM1_OIKDI|nr:unnamed protein product [Oikopleura dioica]